MALKVDWFRVFVDLKRGGLSFAAVEHRLSIPDSTLKRYANNLNEPRHTEGEQIISLWIEVTHRQRDDLPKQVRTISAAKS